MDPKYKSMVKRMKEKSGDGNNSSADEPWHLYILRCRDGSLYTGIAKNPAERIKKHNDGKGAAYTRTHRPVKLVYSEMLKNRTEALVREMRIKSLSRLQKEELLKQKIRT